MLTSSTKQKIDSARDILVGKITMPTAQVEQITLALLFKFMHDIDVQNVSIGAKPKFFTGEYEKYNWSNIIDKKLSGLERVMLYGEALEKMFVNPNLPPFFRSIFKGAFLPFRDPEVLKLFLNQINEFEYSHSEELGNAFEYLLSSMDSQGEAGQLRTPRHIIDFIVEAVDPQKDDRILDPACGTAGFLISSYKHILKNNIDPKSQKPGSALSFKGRQKLTKNFAGYDISHDMVRLSSVNMFLHDFPEPQIFEYDTLGNLEKWNDDYDCILANPPFMTPKGGVRPHKRFSIQANRSEVLFVDYILEHLTTTGKAGIIVPEGIIFQSGNAYKQLRKMLVENYLWAVISLPAGVFNPYSGVKTSILLIDKQLNKKSDSILFVKIENDGFDLGATKREIDKNDLPETIKLIKNYKNCHSRESGNPDTKNALLIPKSKIASKEDYNLSIDRYRVNVNLQHSNFDKVRLGEISEVISGQSPESEFYNDKKQGLPFYQGKTEFGEMYIGEPKTWTTKITKSAIKDDILMSVRAPVGPVNIATQEICIGRGVAAIRPNDKILRTFLFYFLRSIQNDIKGSGGAVFDSINRNQIMDLQIPLPPLSVQQEIVNKIESYQSIINGARQVVENYKPQIDINPEWKMVELGEADIEIIDGDRGINYPKKEDFTEKGYCLFLNTKNVRQEGFLFDELDFISEKIDKKLRKGKLTRNDIVLTTRGTLGNVAVYDSSVPYDNIRINSGMLIFRPNIKIVNPYYLFKLYQSEFIREQFFRISSGSAQPQLPIRSLINVHIPIPPLDEQQQIVSGIEQEQKLVDANKELIKLYEKKIKDEINKVWEK